MAKRFKTLIFSMTFLTCSTFSAHAMLSEEADRELRGPTRPEPRNVDPEEKGKVDAFFSRYNFPDWLRDRVSSDVKGRAFEFHKYGVPNLYFTAALLFYSDRRDPEEFGLLFDLFGKTLPEKRESLWEDLNAFASIGSRGAQLCEFYYDSDGNIDSSAYEVEETETLKYKLLNLPHQ